MAMLFILTATSHVVSRACVVVSGVCLLMSQAARPLDIQRADEDDACGDGGLQVSE